MNLVLLSGTVASPPKLWKGRGNTRLCILDLRCRGHANNKTEFHKVVCWGRLASMVADKLQPGMYVSLLGVIQRKRYKKGKSFSVRTQIEARQINLPLYPEKSDWLQLALLLANKMEEETVEDSFDEGIGVKVSPREDGEDVPEEEEGGKEDADES